MTSHNEPPTSLNSLPEESWPLRYRSWLHLLAEGEVDARLRNKFSASDAVQQTLLIAWQDRDQCRAEEEGQRMAWLRKILANQLAQLARHYAGTKRRDLSRERSIDQSLSQSSQNVAQWLADEGPSPSGVAMALERQRQLSDLLDKLPSDYRTVLILRNIKELPHAEIADRMGKSEGAVRVLWVRALTQLKAELGGAEMG